MAHLCSSAMAATPLVIFPALMTNWRKSPKASGSAESAQRKSLLKDY